jgi:PAS domain S-box-containing protein
LNLLEKTKLVILQRELEKTREELKQTKKRALEALEASDEKYRSLCEDARVLMLRLDRKGYVTYVNRIVKEYGLEKEDILGKSMLAFVTKKDWLRLFKEHLRVMRGNINEGQTEIVTPKGKLIVEYRSNPIQDARGKVVGDETVIRDITEQKNMERQLAEHTTQLEAKVEERTVELNDANAQIRKHAEQLEAKVEERTLELVDTQRKLLKSERLAAIGELAGMVGHDLRNPLAGIKNAAYYLKKKGTAISEAQAKEMLEIIDKAIDHSDKIINDLLDYAREMHLELTKYAAHNLVEEAVRMVQVPDRIQIVNHVHEETWIWVDADKMMRVFINLIKNAVDAMPAEGTLEISGCQTRDNLEIVFADTGMGIPEEILPKIFTPLFTTRAQGMGFGLAICKRIVESHGGTITVKTEVNKGTTFTVTLPIKPKVEVGGEKTWITMPESLLSTTTKA